MKKINILLALILLLFINASCDSFNDAFDTKEIAPLSVNVNAIMSIEGVNSSEGLKVKFDNYSENIHLEKVLGKSTTLVEGLLPGIYSINITGKVTTSSGDEYYVNGSKINYAITKEGEVLDVSINGLKISPLIFSEIFYAGTATFYFRNQFYEIYNNSSKTIYLDGIYFANLTPSTATTKLPKWPDADGANYAYAERVWKFPGSGTDYPVKPGESVVISQFAANHKLAQYNPNSPVDCSSSEFEFNMNNKNFPDQPAVDMTHVFYNGKSVLGSVPQYLTSVMGGAYIIFKVPEGEAWDPVNNTSLSTRDLSGTSTTLYAKVPIKYVLDGVECGQNETMIAAKRVPSVLDAGMTYVGATYNSLGVARYKIGENEDGTPILMDTNNSTDDFERGVIPTFRRYGSKMPSWNHTLKGNN
ncbi:DUF4876 domain-containing protein [uncultured Bacteroides sp.]|uniref:DUF4876 domain-containing protein n=1 Tax=uncultured Bacteroides sp. TaxID=162156 RepID=UPI002AAC3E61|nr:DUF4876 domain-containing protein [uncultured Bacteroides sp.]